ncbi:MAG: hypothetical protein JSV86_04570 [Gemmatimonadota bacterium]|nr:MAG: hypothetical protein JSV86_04570 [Gemmatimonadota bacterium]
MADKLEIQAAWLNSEIAIYEAYHSHKEKMAWTATVLALGAAIALVFSTLPPAIGQNSILTTIAVSFLGLSAYAFVSLQFKLRWEASDAIDALKRARTRVCMKETWDEALLDSSVSDVHEVYPVYVSNEISLLDTPRGGKEMLLACLTLLWPPIWGEMDNRWRTEIASYFALAVAFAAVVVRIWLN